MEKIYNLNTLKIETSITFSLSDWIRHCNGRYAFVYLVRLYNDDEDFIKVGRTCGPIARRMETIPYQWDLIYADYLNPVKSFKMENELHSFLSSIHPYSPCIPFSGMTECYSLDAIFPLSEKLNFQIIENNYEKT